MLPEIYIVAGLGIGFLNKELIDNHTFNSVTIIENSQDVIDLVWPYCARDSRFTLIKEDIETWNIPQVRIGILVGLILGLEIILYHMVDI